ncbi:MAG TPA: alpha/beta hydrolase [Euzebya sp.]|nr:alpha/beta hydrolase [Euzebya sp.]
MADQDALTTSHTQLFDGLAVQRRQLDVNGIATSVIEGGQGDPLLLLHGGIQAGGAVWWRVVPHLLQRHRVVIPDLPGLGRSAPTERLDADAFTTWLIALLELTCADKPTLLAHSAPGGLAARFAARHGGLLRRLVLVDPAGLATFRPTPGFVLALLRANLRPSARSAEGFLRRVVADLDRTRDGSGPQWEDFVGYLAARSQIPHVKGAMRQLVKAGTTRLSEAELQRITVPTALMWGRHDPLFPVRAGESASTRHGWPLQIVDAAGHLPHVEQPTAFVEGLDTLTRGT